MHLTVEEQAMLDGRHGEVIARALDYLVQLGEAFEAEQLVDLSYAHYPAEMSIYHGSCEDVIAYAETGAKVRIPTTSSTLACDLERWSEYGCPQPIHDLQAKAVEAHRKMGILGTYTCTPQLLGFVLPKGSNIISVESSAIIYFNSVLGARTNRGGLFTRYAAVTGKYPLTGYLIAANRRGTHLFTLDLEPDDLAHDSDYSALGFYIGAIVGSEVPVIDGLPMPTQDNLVALGAALATSGSVTLFHAPPHTAEANTVDDAFQGGEPKEAHTVRRGDLHAAYEKITNISDGEAIDFVTLGCPHYTLGQLRYVASWLHEHDATAHENMRFWICTNRMTKRAADFDGITAAIEAAGGFVVCDTCPVECHMRKSTCKEFGLPVPQVKAMVTDSFKMARYVGDLIGCRTAVRPREACLRAAVSGKLE